MGRTALFSKLSTNRMVSAAANEKGEIVAIKKLKKKYYKWEHCISQKEIQSLIKLSHPNIV